MQAWARQATSPQLHDVPPERLLMRRLPLALAPALAALHPAPPHPPPLAAGRGGAGADAGGAAGAAGGAPRQPAHDGQRSGRAGPGPGGAAAPPHRVCAGRRRRHRAAGAGRGGWRASQPAGAVCRAAAVQAAALRGAPCRAGGWGAAPGAGHAAGGQPAQDYASFDGLHCRDGPPHVRQNHEGNSCGSGATPATPPTPAGRRWTRRCRRSCSGSCRCRRWRTLQRRVVCGHGCRVWGGSTLPMGRRCPACNARLSHITHPLHTCCTAQLCVLLRLCQPLPPCCAGHPVAHARHAGQHRRGAWSAREPGGPGKAGLPPSEGKQCIGGCARGPHAARWLGRSILCLIMGLLDRAPCRRCCRWLWWKP